MSMELEYIRWHNANIRINVIWCLKSNESKICAPLFIDMSLIVCMHAMSITDWSTHVQIVCSMFQQKKKRIVHIDRWRHCQSKFFCRFIRFFFPFIAINKKSIQWWRRKNTYSLSRNVVINNSYLWCNYLLWRFSHIQTHISVLL